MSTEKVSEFVTLEEAKKREHGGHRPIHRIPKGAQYLSNIRHQWQETIDAIGGIDNLPKLHLYPSMRRRIGRRLNKPSPKGPNLVGEINLH